MKIVLLFLFAITFYYLKFVMHLSIDWKTLYRKGFKKIDNAFGVFCYCGKQGHGKTYSAVKFCIDRKLSTNCLIITNVQSFRVFSDTVYITNIYDMIDYVINYMDDFYKIHSSEEEPNILIFYDEIFTILNKNKKIDETILSFLSQLRKRRIILITTAQEWLEVNVTFRRYVRFQIDCNMLSLPIAKTAIILNYINDSEQMKWSNEENEYIAPRIATNIAKGNLAIIESYDTFETIKTGLKNNKK